MFNFLQETVNKIAQFSGYDGEPAIVFLPNRGLYIECNSQIVLFESDNILLRTKNGAISVHGSGLSISSLDSGSIFLGGNITKVEVEGN